MCFGGSWEGLHILGRLIWGVPVFLWVAAPILSYWPGTTPRLYHLGWWVIASIFVIACAPFNDVTRQSKIYPYLLLGCIAVFLSHALSIGTSLIWLYQVSIILVAAWLIAERFDLMFLKLFIVGMGLLQIPFMILQLFGIYVFPSDMIGLTGTLEKRAYCAILLASASFLTAGRLQWLLTITSILTGSFMCLPAVIRLLWPMLKRGRMIGLMAIPAILIATHSLWLSRVTSRFKAMESLEFLQRGWLTGWGFIPFPGGFVYSAVDSGGSVPAMTFYDYHSTLIDWVARTGLIGFVVLCLLAYWISRHLKGGQWRLWTSIMAAWAFLLQSAESGVVMAMLFLVWLSMIETQVEG